MAEKEVVVASNTRGGRASAKPQQLEMAQPTGNKREFTPSLGDDVYEPALEDKI